MSFELDGFSVRKTEQYGGRDIVGSTLWLEHSSGLLVPTDEGDIAISEDDLRADEQDLHNHGYFDLRKLTLEVAEGLSTVELLRNYLLPFAPLRISGNTSKSKLSLQTDVAIFKTPRDFTLPGATIAAKTFSEEQQHSHVPTFSVRFTPREGEVSGIGIYPGGTTSEEFILSAIETDERVTRAVIGGRVLFECFRQPQDSLPPQIAPHQF